MHKTQTRHIIVSAVKSSYLGGTHRYKVQTDILRSKKKDNSTTQHFCKVGSFSDCILRSVVKKATSVSSGLMLNTLSFRHLAGGFRRRCAVQGLGLVSGI